MNLKQWLIVGVVVGTAVAGSAGIALAVMNANAQIAAAADRPE
jgi:hypothetical protein